MLPLKSNGQVPVGSVQLRVSVQTHGTGGGGGGGGGEESVQTLYRVGGGGGEGIGGES